MSRNFMVRAGILRSRDRGDSIIHFGKAKFWTVIAALICGQANASTLNVAPPKAGDQPRQGHVVAAHQEMLQHVRYYDGFDQRDTMSANVKSTDPKKHIDLTGDEMNAFMKTTGNFVCWSNKSQREVPATADVRDDLQSISLAIHEIENMDPKSCSFKNFANPKGIKVIIANKDIEKLSSWISNGRNFDDERITLRLKEKVKGATAFKHVPKDYVIPSNTEILVVSGYQTDWGRRNGLKSYKDLHEPLAYKCIVSGVDPTGMAAVSDCPLGPAGSGAKAYVRTNGELMIAAMFIGANGVRPDGTKIPDGSSYDVRYNNTVAIVWPELRE